MKTPIEKLVEKLFDCGVDISLFKDDIDLLKKEEKQYKIDLLKDIQSQLSTLQKQSTVPSTSGDKRGGEYRIALSKAKDVLEDNIYLITIEEK